MRVLAAGAESRVTRLPGLCYRSSDARVAARRVGEIGNTQPVQRVYHGIGKVATMLKQRPATYHAALPTGFLAENKRSGINVGAPAQFFDKKHITEADIAAFFSQFSEYDSFEVKKLFRIDGDKLVIFAAEVVVKLNLLTSGEQQGKST